MQQMTGTGSIGPLTMRWKPKIWQEHLRNINAYARHWLCVIIHFTEVVKGANGATIRYRMPDITGSCRGLQGLLRSNCSDSRAVSKRYPVPVK